MKFAVEFALVPAVLAWPNAAHDHRHLHHRDVSPPGYGASPSSVSGTAPYSVANSTYTTPAALSTGIPDTCSVVVEMFTQTVTVTGTAPAAAASSAAASAPAAASAASSAPPAYSAASSVPATSAAASSVAASAAPSASSVAAVAASSSPAASSSSSSSSSGSAAPAGSKRGLLVPVGDVGTDYALALGKQQPNKISWVNNWYSGPPGNLSSDILFVPQCYNYKSNQSGEWWNNAQTAMKQGQKWFLSFGEPDMTDDHMDAPTAANQYMSLMQPWAEKGVAIGAPGNLAEQSDLTWTNDFLKACDGLGCKISWISCHWVSGCAASDTAQSLSKHFLDFVDSYKQIASPRGMKIWIDNMTLDPTQCNKSIISDFLDIVIPKIDADDGVAKYSWISSNDITNPNGMVASDKTLTPLGVKYATM